LYERPLAEPIKITETRIGHDLSFRTEPTHKQPFPY
jgi:hypothetical protein